MKEVYHSKRRSLGGGGSGCVCVGCQALPLSGLAKPNCARMKHSLLAPDLNSDVRWHLLHAGPELTLPITTSAFLTCPGPPGKGGLDLSTGASDASAQALTHVPV